MAAVPAALAAFLHAPDDIVQVTRFAIRAGGDTDTIATMAGALAGARNGAAGIPESWLARLEHRDRIEQTAQDLIRSLG